MIETILLLNPVYVTLFWAVVLNFYNHKKYPPKAFLGKFMIVAFILYLSHFFYFTGQHQIYHYIDGFYILASLLVYPMYHIYIRLLTSEQYFSLKKHGKYLAVPVVISVFYIIGALLMTTGQHEIFLKGSNLESQDAIAQYMQWVYYVARGIFVLQVFFYLYVNFRLIIVNNNQLQDYYSNTDDRRLQWVQFFNISFAITSIASIAAAITGREAFASGVYSLAGPSIVFSSMLFFIGLLGNTQNTVHTQAEETEPSIPEEPSQVPESDIKRQMEELFATQQIFKNPDLKIWDLSKMLGTNRTYISRFINQEYNRNFCNHVNHYRVGFIKEVLRDNPAMSNEQIADISGFGSVSSLYRAFKNADGISFSAFRKEHQQNGNNSKTNQVQE
ncbi:MAG: AraC family transcriptional regulator [Bacteroidetes bacterium]|nr:MAG: AraC family transcriptional regulator [Bacteroidota bacterium]